MPVEDEDFPSHEEGLPPPEFANVGPSPAPTPSSTAPEDTEAHRVTDAEVSEPDEPLPEFDPRVREDFEGLMYLGKLTHPFDWLGHKFVIRTMTTGEILEAGLIHREYVGTVADVRAYQACVVAACVVSVDDKHPPYPLTSADGETLLRTRFNYVIDKWFPPTLDKVYNEYLVLEARVEAVIEAMGKAPGWTELTRTSEAASV